MQGVKAYKSDGHPGDDKTELIKIKVNKEYLVYWKGELRSASISTAKSSEHPIDRKSETLQRTKGQLLNYP
jgi:hypothetical protein